MTTIERPTLPPLQTLGAFKFVKPSEIYKREKLYTLSYNPDNGLKRTNIELDERENILIKDMRSMHENLSWETSGIAVKTISPKLAEDGFDDVEMIKNDYYSEVETVLQTMFRPSKVVILEHVLRKRDPMFPMSTGLDYEFRQPTSIVHVDYTSDSATDAMERLLGLNPAEYSRIIAVNIWKPLHGPLQDWPLALCDGSSVNEDRDLVSADIVERYGYSENSRVYHSPEHQWYYLSGQLASEILIFRQYDSKAGMNPVPHSGFQIPNPDPQRRARESIELRAFVLYD